MEPRPYNELSREGVETQYKRRREEGDDGHTARINPTIRQNSDYTINEGPGNIITIMNNHAIKPLSNGIRRIVSNKNNSCIVIGVTCHGGMRDFPKDYPQKYRDNVYILSLASCGNVAITSSYDEDNREQLELALAKNYPIISSFKSLRTYITDPTSVTSLETKKYALDSKHILPEIVNAIDRKEHGGLHLFSNNMYYESTSYTSNEMTPSRENFPDPIVITIYDVRYPKTQNQLNLLNINLDEDAGYIELIESTQLTEMLHNNDVIKIDTEENEIIIDNDDVSITTDDMEYIHTETLYLSDLVKFLKDDMLFDNIFIFESTCRESRTRMTEAEKTAMTARLRAEYSETIKNKNVALLGGRRTVKRRHIRAAASAKLRRRRRRRVSHIRGVSARRRRSKRRRVSHIQGVYNTRRK